ncbi:MAG: amino acid adenylation domain-containing protein, partial [bacterium]|nr:amino acid adenylation domain-containing protein [bacterium]
MQMKQDRVISAGDRAAAASHLEKEKQYWLEHLAGEPGKSAFPYDRPAAGDEGQRGAVAFTFPTKVYEGLERLRNGSDLRLHMILTAGLVLLLNKYSYEGNNDIVIGAPVLKQETGRQYINTILVLRTLLTDHMTFKDLLLSVRQTIAEATEHQNYPIDALFDVALLLENIHTKTDIDHTSPGILFSFNRTGQDIRGTVDYNPLRYDKTTVGHIIRHYTQVFLNTLFTVDKPLAEVEIVSQEEKQRVLSEFNSAANECPIEKTLHRLVEEQVLQTPDRIALLNTVNEAVTYGELNRRANHLAHRLYNDYQIRPGQPVGLLLEQPFDQVIAILGVLKAGGAYLPIDPQAPGERIDYMLKDSGAEVVVDTGLMVKGPCDTDELPNPQTIEPANLAYIIYTSGSTGTPKGVLVEHRTVSAMLQARREEYRMDGTVRALQLFSCSFDGYITGLFTPLISGASLVVTRSEELKDASRLIPVLTSKCVTHFISVPSLFRVMLEVMNPGDASLLRVVTLAGEAVTQDLLDLAREKIKNKDFEIINEYGITETSVMSTLYRHQESSSVISIGRPIRGTGILIANHAGQLQPVGVPGEIHISGAGVARGYLNNPGLTNDKFERNPTLYKTGDLGKWHNDGNIEFLGRIDGQVKIRGYRIETGEIENRLRRCDGVAEAVVVGDAELCAYVVLRKETQPGTEPIPAIIEELEQSLPGYMIPTFILPLETMPLTSGGKLDRNALPGPGEVVSAAPYAAPVNEAQRELAGIWAEVLNIDPAVIGIDDNFFRLGGHSLRATVLSSKIRKTFNAEASLPELFKYPTIREFSQALESSAKVIHESIPPVEKQEYYPQSPAQKRLYILHQLGDLGTAYNMPGVLNLEGKVDVERLESVFHILIDRHESTRTGFVSIADQPVQRIHDHVDFEIEFLGRGVPPWSPLHGNHSGFIRPFDLSRAPLLRVGLITLSETRHVLLTDMHHIICDGISMGVLQEDFVTLYNGEELTPPRLRLQFKDFSQWQTRRLEREIHGQLPSKQREFWLDCFHGEIPVLALDYDFPRPAVQEFEGSRTGFGLDKQWENGLRELAIREDVTLYMVLLGLFNVLLYKLSGRQDIVVGTPAAGRRHDDLERIVGMFVNTLAIRSQPVADLTFSAFLRRVKTLCLDAFENQEYPFEELVDQVAVKRDISRNPLFDVMFSLFTPQPSATVDDYNYNDSLDEYESTISKLDLSLEVNDMPGGGGLAFGFEYCTRLFKQETIQRYTSYFKCLVSAAVTNPAMKLWELDIIPEEEKRQILEDFNGTRSFTVPDRTIHQLFEEQASRVPDHAAVAFIETITYGELNRRADRLALGLKEKGLGPGSIAAIMMPRSVEMMIAIIGILKAGAAYLPIDPGYPPERIDFMLKDSAAKVVVSSDLMVDELDGLKVKPLHGSNMSANQSTHLAYIIYTSGSTGRPKGVAIEHRGFINTCRMEIKVMNITDADKVLQFAPLSFDASVLEIFMAFFTGGVLVLVSDEQILDIDSFVNHLNRHEISILTLPPAYLSQLARTAGFRAEKIKSLITGGEAPNIEDVKYCSRVTDYFNDYGPTEASVSATIYKFPPGYEGPVTIGKPIDNMFVYILDQRENLCPIGVSGELCIGGIGLARGYLNNPGLTAERFISAPSALSGVKLYKSGDLARWMPDGNIEFLGRIDYQVKIRGFRVELGEIESVLLSHPAVEEAVVLAEKDGSGISYLAAFTRWKENEGVPVSQLREFLSARLPGYMVPSYFISIDGVPLTPNNKVDRQALKALVGKPDSQEELSPPKNQTEQVVANTWKELLNLDRVGVHDNFFEVGGNSIRIIELARRLKETLGREIPIPKVYLYPTIASFARFLEDNKEDNETHKTPQETVEPAVTGHEVAVIGMAGRFPGAGDIDAFWDNLKNGVESVSYLDEAELETVGVAPGEMDNGNYVKSPGALLEGMEYFDASFFGYSPIEAQQIAPQTRLFHECLWEALEDGGYWPDAYAGEIGLYAGASSSYGWELLSDSSARGTDLDPLVTGYLNNRDFAATLIAYRLNLRGIGFTLHTACSTSLVAVHLACRGLLNGDCDMVLAGGVGIRLQRRAGYMYREGFIHSPDGHCRTFDTNAQGSCGGDGAGVVLLKPLQEAVKDRDHIYAVIKGSAVNNDGSRKAGYAAPGIDGQSAVIRKAHLSAKVKAQDIGYVETHGTGTPIGDVTEVEALKMAFDTKKLQYCALGAVKTNIGHLDVAAGIAGFIKTVLMLKHRRIPPTLHFESPNPRIDFKNSPFYVNAEPREWKRNPDEPGTPLLAGVSAFGIGGTNAHVVLEEWRGKDSRAPGSPSHRPNHIILLSARSQTALDQMTANLAEHLERNPQLPLADIAYTLQVGRKPFRHRRKLVCADAAEAAGILTKPDSRSLHSRFLPDNDEGKHPVFIFPGLGSQYENMGLGLYE